MKKIILLLFLVGIAYYGYHKVSRKDSFPTDAIYGVTIKQLKQNPSRYADSEIKLENVEVVHSQTFLDHSLSMIQDGTDSIILLSGKPYHIGDNINVQGQYQVVYSNGNESIDMFVADYSSN